MTFSYLHLSHSTPIKTFSFSSTCTWGSLQATGKWCINHAWLSQCMRMVGSLWFMNQPKVLGGWEQARKAQFREQMGCPFSRTSPICSTAGPYVVWAGPLPLLESRQRVCCKAQGDGSPTCPAGIDTLPLQQPETLRLRSWISSYRQNNSYIYALVNMNYWHRLFRKSSQRGESWGFSLFTTRRNRDAILELQTTMRNL